MLIVDRTTFVGTISVRELAFFTQSQWRLALLHTRLGSAPYLSSRWSYRMTIDCPTHLKVYAMPKAGISSGFWLKRSRSRRKGSPLLKRLKIDFQQLFGLAVSHGYVDAGPHLASRPPKNSPAIVVFSLSLFRSDKNLSFVLSAGLRIGAK